jgi:hypothetical protein
MITISQANNQHLFFKKILWPLLFFGCTLIYWLGVQLQHPILAYNIAYFSLALSLFFLERTMPHEPLWLASDGQMFNDLGHTFLTKGVSQLLATSAALFGVKEFGPEVLGPPHRASMVASLVLACSAPLRHQALVCKYRAFSFNRFAVEKQFCADFSTDCWRA